MDNFMNAFIIMGTSLVYILICIGFAYVAWLTADWRTKEIDDIQLIDDGNMAYPIEKSNDEDKRELKPHIRDNNQRIEFLEKWTEEWNKSDRWLQSTLVDKDKRVE